MNNGNIFQQLIAATFTVGAYEMHWLEFIGILIGAASAYLGMERWVWAWPVGIVANIMLFFVGLGALLALRKVVAQGRFWAFALYLVPLGLVLIALDLLT